MSESISDKKLAIAMEEIEDIIGSVVINVDYGGYRQGMLLAISRLAKSFKEELRRNDQ